MRHNRYFRACASVILIIASVQLAACKQNASEVLTEPDGPVKIERMGGTDPTKVTLTEDAAKRLDVQTAAVREEEINGAKHKIIPYAAILYDTDGTTWTYTNPEPFVYVRHPIKVDSIKGNDAILSDDLPAGTTVVIVGAAELYGSETEFSEE